MNYTPPPHITQNWHITKPAANGKRGIVVSQAKPAAEAGVALLEAGGPCRITFLSAKTQMGARS